MNQMLYNHILFERRERRGEYLNVELNQIIKVLEIKLISL